MIALAFWLEVLFKAMQRGGSQGQPGLFTEFRRQRLECGEAVVTESYEAKYWRGRRSTEEKHQTSAWGPLESVAEY